MVNTNTARNVRIQPEIDIGYLEFSIEPVRAAEIILRKVGARAISMLTSPREFDGRLITPRLSANDCYAALEESCRKMARVALRKFESDASCQNIEFEDALDILFPDAAAYLTRCIRSVISDSERVDRRELPTLSLDQPISQNSSSRSDFCLRDILTDPNTAVQPEIAAIEQDERSRFRNGLAHALQGIPKNYMEALQRDISRDRERQNGLKVTPETDRERQTICRARAALAIILKRECGEDNPYIHMLAKQRNSRVRQKSTHSPNWSTERQNDLFRRLLDTSWTERTDDSQDGNVEEAVVNEVSKGGGLAPPSPEMRLTMRVMDTYTLGDNPTAETAEAQELYVKAQNLRYAGKIEQAIQQYRDAYHLDSNFFPAISEVGVLLSQTGNLRDALSIYLGIVANPQAGEHRYIAATNAADIYLTWFDTGRNREKNIEQATLYARLAMEKPTPMRACNLLLALIKDRYYREAQETMEAVLHSSLANCPAEKFLQTLFQIRDADLVSWWNWLEEEMGKENKND